MQLLDRLVRRLAALSIALAALSLLASLALIVYSVAMRYFVNQPVAWVDELVGYLLVATVMLAAADALLEGEHIAVDILTERLSARGRRATLLAGLVTVGASAVLLAVEGWDMVAFSRMVGLKSNGYMATDMWIPQLVVPIGAALMGLAALAALAAAWRKRPAPDAGADAPHAPADIE
jgi:TRAP-type C4-dicarboxylate transport system permease small subunit